MTYLHFMFIYGISQVAQTVKNLPTMQETQVRYLSKEDTLEKGMATYSSILAGESYGQRSLEGNSSWGHQELDTTKQLILSLIFITCFYCPSNSM